MRVAILDEWLPYPLDNGKKIRSYHLLIPQAQQHHLTYIAPRSGNREVDDHAETHLRDNNVEVLWVNASVPRNGGLLFAPRLAGNLLSPLPYSVQRHASRAMRQAAADLARRTRIDLWHVEWTPYVQNLPAGLAGRRVIDAHNIESQIWQRHAETEKNPLRSWYIQKQWQKFASFEQKAFTTADCVITTTELDAQLAQRQFGANCVEVISNGVDLERFCYVAAGRDRYELLFLGSLAWRPNLDAVKLLLDSIFPAVRAAEPRARLTIVGLNPPAWLESAAARAPGVKLHANVPDVRPYLERCGALLVPLRIGGGSRIKILEALATGCPVISTEVGAEGLELRPNVDYFHVQSTEHFADLAINGLREYERLASTAEQGNRVVRDRYGWAQLSDRLSAVWEACVQQPEAALT